MLFFVGGKQKERCRRCMEAKGRGENLKRRALGAPESILSHVHCRAPIKIVHYLGFGYAYVFGDLFGTKS